jgi:hypothetical protein
MPGTINSEPPSLGKDELAALLRIRLVRERPATTGGAE